VDSGRPARREKANQRTEQGPSSHTWAPRQGRKSQRPTSPKERDEERHSSVGGKCHASDKQSSQGIPPAEETETAETETGSEDEFTEAMEEEVVVRKRTLVKRVREAGDSGEDLAPPEKR
jgi:hypothetical protein